MTENKVFRFLIFAILTFTLIFLLSLTRFVFVPIGAVLASVAVPLIGAGFFYYITKPLLNLLERFKIPRLLAILIVFLVLIVVIFLNIYFIIPPIQEQINSLIQNWPAIQSWGEDLIAMWRNGQEFIPAGIQETIDDFINNLGNYTENIATSLFSFLGAFVSFLVSFVLIPFFLFFMLKDSESFVPYVTSFFSKSKGESLARLLNNINDSLGSFIQAQALVSLSVGIMLLIGYLIVGLDYALIFAVFALFMNFIPYIGPWVSAIPAVIVGFFQDPMVGVWTAVVMIVAQQVESNLIEPNIMGKVLKVHPLTVVVIILAAGATVGFVGLILAVPAYAVIKTIAVHFYEEYKKMRPVGKKNIW
ncbi:Predicted PurR-regulated permease PerM [Amphibacillus marinus]|uniref:Predicted PurR-regulated permease PerM n=1 Tax=Amphibacillus marinus TaxID=872970 RepID=A0A1H8K9Y3_9BACI|nr:AI-2E family transporter [Amphibacillus marinus]SEN89763.1 Predicted PurR-regulated permease PerM [Amphibacillus marinus]